MHLVTGQMRYNNKTTIEIPGAGQMMIIQELRTTTANLKALNVSQWKSALTSQK